jgi:CHAD domain-containing protein
LLRLVRPPLGDVYARENAFYRDAARDLSDIRDAHVTLETFEQLLAHFAPTLDEAAFEPLRAALERRRELGDTQHALAERLDRFKGRMAEGRDRLSTWRISDDGFDALAEGFALTYRRGRKAMRAACRDPGTETIHEWRKRAKYHWYHVRLLQGIWDAPMRAVRREIRTLSDLLGDDHDLAVLREIVLAEGEGLGEPTVLETVVGLVDRRQVELRREAARLGGRLYADSPSTLLRRLECFWDCWYEETAPGADGADAVSQRAVHRTDIEAR